MSITLERKQTQAQHIPERQPYGDSVVRYLDDLIKDAAQTDNKYGMNRAIQHKKQSDSGVPHIDIESAHQQAMHDTLMQAADAITEKLDAGTAPDRSIARYQIHLLQTASQLGDFANAIQQLDLTQSRLDILHNNRRQLEHRGGHFSKWQNKELSDLHNQSRELKTEYIIPFNQSIKDIIDTNGAQLTRRGLARALTMAYMRHFAIGNPENHLPPEAMHTKMVEIINGMKHELATESLLSATGIDYDYNITPQQDQQGIDIFVHIDGRRAAVDVKASEGAVRRALQRNERSYAVWTGLRDEDFGGPEGLVISWDTAREKGPEFADRIRQMVRVSHVLGQQAYRSNYNNRAY